jgi:hypothetical protein
VNTWQDASTDADWTHSAGIATVNPWLAGQNLTTHDFCFQTFENRFDFIGGQCIGFFGDQC